MSQVISELERQNIFVIHLFIFLVMTLMKQILA